MFRFENEEYIWLLGVIVIIALFYFVGTLVNAKRIKSFGDKSLFERLFSERSTTRQFLKIVLVSIAFISLVLAIMNPQIGTKMEEVKREGIEIIVAVDISNSMLAEDIKPNRIERAKQSILQLVDNIYNDKIGIIIFAGESFLQLPLTTDYSAAKLLVSSISTDLIPTQGTAIGSAIELATDSFSSAEEGENEVNKVLIIITDGENHEDDAIGQAELAVEKGIIVNTIGMGSKDGGPIPIYQNGINVGYRKDRSGETIVTKLNDGMLTEIASKGNGRFLRASSANIDLKQIADDLESIEKTEFESKVFTDYEDRFQYLIAFALCIMLLEFVLNSKKSKFIKGLVRMVEK